MPPTQPEPQDDAIWVPPSARRAAAEPEPGADASAEPEPAAEPEPEPDWQDRYLRAVAEIDNIRRRTAEQARVSVQRANQEFLLGLLPVVDGFDRALASAAQGATVESLIEGLRLLQAQFAGVLQRADVTPIEAEPGTEFDPEVHEAMVRVPPSEAAPAGHIAGVVEAGWLLAGRVLRPARVAVAGEALESGA